MNRNSLLGGWTVRPPYFCSPNFNADTGLYNVPATGRYSIMATINYSTTAAITGSLCEEVNPAFAVRRIAPTATNLISGLLPILNVNNKTLFALRVILGAGTVTLAGEVELNAGDVIGLFYVNDGLTLNLTLGGVVWSMNRLT